MEDLLRFLLKPLVSDIDDVKIEKIELGENNVTYKIIVPQTDIAKTIGKEGKMIKSIKNLLKIRAIKQNIFVNVEVEEA